MLNRSIKQPFCMPEEPEDTIIYDVVIIGAGLSGLTAALRLFQMRPNFSIKILEAQDRIGGRLYSSELPAMNHTIDTWDLGGSWIGSKEIQPFINQVLTELNMQTYPQNFVGKKIVQTGSNNAISKYSASVPDIGVLSLFDTMTLLKYINNMQKTMPDIMNVEEIKMKEYDSMTAETFIRHKIWTQSTYDITRAAIRACFGSELEKLSSLYLLMYANSCGGFIKMVESSPSSSQGYKIVGGAQSICFRILDIIGYSTLELSTVVRSIRQVIGQRDEPTLLVETNKNMYKAKNVILSIPIHLIPNIQFYPMLSPTKYEFFTSVSPGHLIKVILTYEKDFWKNDGFSGEIVTNGGPSFTDGCITGPLCVVFDATTSNGSPALVGVIGGDQALQYEKVSQKERKEAVLKSLESLFQSSNVRDYIVYCERVWRQEPYVGGCPVSTVPPGVAKHFNQELWASENRIHFAGSELAKSWMGFMEGAVESGERAAIEILTETHV